jgi:putative glycosyltransferase (TIGR04348 family)
MLIRFLLPASEAIRNGNAVTSGRWRSFLEGLGHEVFIDRQTALDPCDLLVVFNAYRNRAAIVDARRKRTAGAIVVCLTGTDLYVDMKRDPASMSVLDLADRIAALQPMALGELPPALRCKTQVIFQSALRPSYGPTYSPDYFDACVIAHLRDVKDPLRAAYAARLLPPESRVRVTHVGRPLTEDYVSALRKEERENPRFRRLGELSAQDTAEVLLNSRVLVLSSIQEGGANVVSEAVVCGVPPLVTRIPCTIGLLGTAYPGFFHVGDTEGLAGLLRRAETDPGFYDDLRERIRAEASKFSPSLEKEGLKELVSCATAGARMHSL